MEATGHALVTGASRGLGRAVAVELADRGFDVVATMRDPTVGVALVEATRPSPGSIRVERLDVTDPATIRIPERLRVLVNNAGVEGAYLPVEHADPDDWRAMLETNVLGPLLVTRAALPSLRSSGNAVVCNVTSSSVLAPMPFYGAYRASKAALSALGESLAAEVVGFGIRVLEVLPGPIATDMLASSDRIPEAAAWEEYRPLADRVHDARRGVEDMVTDAATAAATIVDAICDDDAPLRVACDPLAAGMLDGWRAQPDEAWFRSLLAGLAGPGAHPPPG